MTDQLWKILALWSVGGFMWDLKSKSDTCLCAIKETFCQTIDWSFAVDHLCFCDNDWRSTPVQFKFETRHGVYWHEFSIKFVNFQIFTQSNLILHFNQNINKSSRNCWCVGSTSVPSRMPLRHNTVVSAHVTLAQWNE